MAAITYIGDLMYLNGGEVYLTPAAEMCVVVKEYRKAAVYWKEGLLYLFFMYSRHSPMINKPLEDRVKLVREQLAWDTRWDKSIATDKSAVGKAWNALVSFYIDLHTTEKERTRRRFEQKIRSMTDSLERENDPDGIVTLSKAIEAMQKHLQRMEREVSEEGEETSMGMLTLFELPEDQKPLHLKLME